MKQSKDCKVNGNLGRYIVNGKLVFGICPYVQVGGGCGAHGNKKCQHMIKQDNIARTDEAKGE